MKAVDETGKVDWPQRLKWVNSKFVEVCGEAPGEAVQPPGALHGGPKAQCGAPAALTLTLPCLCHRCSISVRCGHPRPHLNATTATTVWRVVRHLHVPR